MKTINKNQILILLYQVLVFNSVLNSSQFSRVPFFSAFTRIVQLTIVFSGAALWLFGKKIINKAVIGIALILIAISLVVMKESDSRIAIIMLLYLMIIYKDIDPQLFCKKYVEAAVLAMLLIIMLYLMGVFPSEYKYRIGFSGVVQRRYYLGFKYATGAPNFAFHISLAYLFYKQEKFRIKDVLILLIPNTILYFLTYTRAAYYEVICAIIAFWLIGKINQDWFKKTISFISIWSMPFFASVELYIAKKNNISNQIYVLMDKLLSYRLSWVAKALRVYPIGLFGNRITWEANTFTESSQLVDMFYLRCAIQYGLVFLFAIIIGFMGVSSYFRYKENYYGCVIILILAIHSITDPQLLEYASVPLLIMLLTGYKYIMDCFKQNRANRRFHKYKFGSSVRFNIR